MANNPDSRKYARRPLNADIEVGDGFQGVELLFESQNVSEGGLFLKSDLLLEEGEVVWISFSLPGTAMAIRTRGKVVWVNKNPDVSNSGDRPGMGVKFLDLNESEIAAITAYLEENP